MSSSHDQSTTFSLYDQRHADTYVVDLDEDGDFALALRYVVGIGRDPIQYTNLADIPQPHRDMIEDEILRRTKF